MPDLESSPSAVGAYPKRGATIYAVEGAILGVVALAWLMIRLQLSATSLADELVLLPYFVGSLFNLLACTLVSDHDLSQGAFFGLCVCLWGVYAYLVMESLLVTGATDAGPDPYARVFFGAMQLFQIPAGVSLAFVSLITLLAGGAISRRLWQQTLWVEVLILMLTALQGGLCGSVLILLLDIVGVVLLILPIVRAWAVVFDSLWWQLAAFFYHLGVVIVTLAVAWSHRTTTVVLPLFLAALLILMLVRLLQPLPPIDIASTSQLVVHDDVAPSAPPASDIQTARPLAPVQGVYFPVPPSVPPPLRSFFPPAPPGSGQALRVLPAPDALLFGHVSRAPGGPRVGKKTL
jgi:hypothetical protein